MAKHCKNASTKLRALEFYARGTPFKPKIVQSKKVYKRSRMKNIDN